MGFVVDKEVLNQLRVCPSVSVYPCHFSLYQSSPFMWTDGRNTFESHRTSETYNKSEDKMLGTCNF